MERLKRFQDAHDQYFQTALAEIKNGIKLSHWMWFIFPQIKGLGVSETSKHYALEDLTEAKQFLEHPVLGANLLSITAELLNLKTNNATAVFGKPDDMKLFSCMTLFALVPGTDPIFQKVLDKYFHGRQDLKTLELAGVE
jgi:uncharacterized protein (DUF1810 family)